VWWHLLFDREIQKYYIQSRLAAGQIRAGKKGDSEELRRIKKKTIQTKANPTP
jgi:hypothetical protein